MVNILITVIVPAYNVEAYIGRCLESILQQSHKCLEVVVVDDGSTDATGRIIEQYAAKDSRIIAIHQENAGLIEVREKGILLANGQYVGFVDGDDAIDPDMYERLLKNAIDYHAEISHCGLRVCYNDGKEELHYGTGRLLVHDKMQGIRGLLEGEQIEPSLCNKLYKKELLFNSCLDKRVLNNEDLLRNFVLFKRATTSVYEDFCGYQYWNREGSMSHNPKIAEQMKCVIFARKRILENSGEEEKLYAIRCWLSSIVNTINILTFIDETSAVELCRECRHLLWTEKKQLKCLIKRQQVAAWLIIISPRLHRFVYKFYKVK